MKKKFKPKLRKRTWIAPLRFLDDIGINVMSNEVMSQIAFEWYYKKSYYKLIDYEISLIRNDMYMQVEITVEKLQNLKSYAKN